MRLLSSVGCVMLVAGSVASADLPADHAARLARGQQLFTKQIRKLLTDQCLNCHGGDKTRGGLDLSSRESLLKGGDHGVAIELWKGKASKLVKLVAHTEEPFMPSKAPKLAQADIDRLAAWIDDGAAYDKPLIDKAVVGKKPMVVTDEDRRFWSFLPLRNPAQPKIKDASWARSPIDRFLLAKLEEKGVKPNPAADRRTLIRRAYFDLIGLPPTPDEVEAFVRDKSDDAWEKVIDKLLASPHYGERWGRHWLDLARFAESHGFEHDYDRPTAYHYRDFVIKALNQDLPYDTFVKWQIAGDELAPDDPLALLATGFLAAGVHSTQITKNQVEKERYDELDDMVRAISTGMLGLSIHCARCHDHKFDPIPTRDYYRVLSTFTTTVRSEMDVVLDPAAYREAKAKFDAAHEKVREPLTRYEKETLPEKFKAWLASPDRKTPAAKWVVLDALSAKSQHGATWTKQDDGSLLASGDNPVSDTYTIVAHTTQRNITAVRLETLAHESMVKSGPGRAANGNFALSDFKVTAAPLKDGKAVPVKLTSAKATFEQKGLPVSAAIDADRKSAWAVDPQFGKDHAAVFELAEPVGFEEGTVLTFTLDFRNNTSHGIGRPRLSVTTAKAPVGLDGDAVPQVVLDLLAADTTKLTEEQRATLLRWFRTTDPEWGKMNRVVAEHALTAPKPTKVKALISSEGVPAVRLHTQGGDYLEETHFLKRGDPNQKDGVARQGFLQVVTRHPDGEKHWQQTPPAGWRTSYRRKALAAWITDVDHGAGHLLARVIANRLWQHHFGRGLVSTVSDFGYQGDKPTHPELLDWLASDLVAHKWSLKHLHKRMMTSAAYTQSSAFDRERAAIDVDNKLLWRRVPLRLEAEIVRDNVLAVGGLLDGRMFGPGSLDANHKRRSIYFFVKRSQLPTSMVLFDAPDALQPTESRPTTTIAPQALLLMNNKLVRQAAEGFAKRLEGKGEEDAVKAAYAIALGRPPGKDDLADSVAFLKEQTVSYRTDKKANPDRLALADFCQVLMGLNEFIYVD